MDALPDNSMQRTVLRAIAGAERQASHITRAVGSKNEHPPHRRLA